jgi:hypothetical protein
LENKKKPTNEPWKKKTVRNNEKRKKEKPKDPALTGRGPYPSARGRSLLRCTRGRSIGFAIGNLVFRIASLNRNQTTAVFFESDWAT